MGNTFEIKVLQQPDGLARAIAEKYVTWESSKEKWYRNARETLEYLYATSARDIYNQPREFDNSTHLPKLTQIRDMLVTYYLEAMFSLPDFVDWIPYSEQSVNVETKNTLKDLVRQMLDDSNFKGTIREIVEDYVDYGDCFATAVPVVEQLHGENGVVYPVYSGPKVVRIDPMSIVFDPMATDFAKSPKVIRTTMTIGELLANVEEMPEDSSVYKEAVQRAVDKRNEVRTKLSSGNKELIEDDICNIAGVGSWSAYYDSDIVELLTFYGDIYDIDANKLYKNSRIIVMDRCYVLLNEPIKNLGYGCNIFKAGWRDRKNNLWSMSPLDNIKGMQFMIDFLENKRADIFNFISNPVFVTKGDAEMPEYYYPGCQIGLDNDADIKMLTPDATALQADLYIDRYLTLMEEMAGTPREAMGFRTPGEKTAFEVSQLNTASSRLFNEKVRKFEQEMLEPLITLMLRIYLSDNSRVTKIKTVNEDGVVLFKEVDLKSLTGNGKFVATGSNTYTEKARIAQTLMQVSNTALMSDPLIMNWFDPKVLAKALTYSTGLDKFNGLLRQNARVDAELEMKKAGEFAQQQLEETQVRGVNNAQQTPMQSL